LKMVSAKNQTTIVLCAGMATIANSFSIPGLIP